MPKSILNVNFDFVLLTSEPYGKVSFHTKTPTTTQRSYMSTPSQAIVETLSNLGVSVIFSLSGNQIMPIYDACIDVEIRIIHTRNEASAVYMAEA